MRYVGAVLLGIFYSLVIHLGLSYGVQLLSGLSEQTYFSHYVLIGLCWFVSVFIGATIACSAVSRHKLPIAMLCAIPLPVALGFMMISDRVSDTTMPVLAFGFAPSVTWWVITLLVGSCLSSWTAAKEA